jgi:NAD+ synthase
VLEIGDELGLPAHLVHKAPSDGMCGKTDEDNLGFTYEQLDDHILGTAAVDEEIVKKIERLHKVTRHKYSPMPTFNPHKKEPYFPYPLPIFELFDYSKQKGKE